MAAGAEASMAGAAVFEAVFQEEAAFEAAADSEEAVLEAGAVLAAPTEVRHLRAPVRMPVRQADRMPLRLGDRAGMALPTMVPYTGARVLMARLAAAAPRVTRGREPTLPDRAAPLLTRTLTAAGTPLAAPPLVYAEMPRPQLLGALAIRRPPGAAAIPANLDGAVLEARERPARA